MTHTLERVDVEVERPRPRRSKRSRWPGIMFLVLLVALGLVASGVLPVQQFLERENQVSAAREDLARLEAENSEIAADVDALTTEQEIERVAREQYGFVRPGEVGYVVIVPPTDEASETEATPVAPVDGESPGFFARIWRFISGGDVVDDG